MIRASRGLFGRNSWGGLVAGWMTFGRGRRLVSRRRERKRERRDCESEFCDESLGIRVEAGLREVEGEFGRCEFDELGEVAGVRVRESSEL